MRLLVSSFFLSLLLTVIPVKAQELPDSASAVSKDGVEAKADEQTYFYAFLEEDHSALGGPLYEMLKEKAGLRDLIQKQMPQERKFRPMLQWRRWADSKQRFLPSFLFLSLVSLISWLLLPKFLQSAAEESRTMFWRSFGTGFLLACISMTFLRAIFISQIGWPLGIVTAALIQAFGLLGLSVSIYNLGHSLSLILLLNRVKVFAEKPALKLSFELLAGSCFAALILLLPGFASLPRAGTRILALFALLGAGALYREWRRRQKAT
ncbi:MAG: hypothetical protein K2X27_16510 [Candidatus Obscuribacterales bacterium]|nr:hypothetical protein [Candidatus Obscuribacterales bacterium]